MMLSELFSFPSHPHNPETEENGLRNFPFPKGGDGARGVGGEGRRKDTRPPKKGSLTILPKAKRRRDGPFWGLEGGVQDGFGRRERRNSAQKPHEMGAASCG